MLNEQTFENEYEKFIAGFFYTAKDANGRWTLVEAMKKLRLYTKLYCEKYNAGMSSQSAFGIVLQEMVNAGDLKPMAIEEDKSSQIAQKIADYDAGRISTYEFRLACKANRELRDAFEAHTGLAQLSAQGR